MTLHTSESVCVMRGVCTLSVRVCLHTVKSVSAQRESVSAQCDHRACIHCDLRVGKERVRV